MLVPFEIIPPSSRIWIYQSERKFTAPEKAIIDHQLQLFTEKWAAHGHPLKSSFQIRLDQFILIAADESYNAASGCSIDDSVSAVQEIGKTLGIDFFNRNLVAFKKEETIALVPLSGLKQKYHEGFWDESTLTFDNLIQTRGEIENEWIIPSVKTWLKRYVSIPKVAP